MEKLYWHRDRGSGRFAFVFERADGGCEAYFDDAFPVAARPAAMDHFMWHVDGVMMSSECEWFEFLGENREGNAWYQRHSGMSFAAFDAFARSLVRVVKPGFFGEAASSGSSVPRAGGVDLQAPVAG